MCSSDLGAVIRTPDAPYTTRVLVRRPASKSRFSGRVVVEMLNPSNLFDLNIGWAIHHDEIVRQGDAWVGITAKPVAAATSRKPIQIALSMPPSPVMAPARVARARPDTAIGADANRRARRAGRWRMFGDPVRFVVGSRRRTD